MERRFQMKNKKSIHAGFAGFYDTVAGILAFPATVIFSTFTFISFIVDYWLGSNGSGKGNPLPELYPAVQKRKEVQH